ncbi:MAG: hypothetical protein K2P93_01545 [Alphaproteobacteria bacterium]|nr:hypothetical protein [Alphaproteobacteria bacterium]
MKNALFFLPFLGVLSACQAPTPRDAQLESYRSRCYEYGYKGGTPEFANCVKEQEEREEKLAVQSRKAQALEEKNWIEQQKVEIKKREVEAKLQSQL